MGVILIGGPTCTGKSQAAIDIAARCGAAIVSADAMTVYRHLDVGTAKPEESVLERFPHACVNVRDPDQDFSVADFVEAVHLEIERSDHVVIVGGTPFYLAALMRPLSVLPSADPSVRESLAEVEDLYEMLKKVDPVIADRLHPNDQVRVIRALEVYKITGQKLSDLQQTPPRNAPLDATVIWLDREGLRERIDARLTSMLDLGYVDEVRKLLEAGWAPTLKPMKSFAYRHMVAHVLGQETLEESVRKTGRDTWRLARKQRNWARSMGWTPVSLDEIHTIARVALDDV